MWQIAHDKYDGHCRKKSVHLCGYSVVCVSKYRLSSPGRMLPSAVCPVGGKSLVFVDDLNVSWWWGSFRDHGVTTLKLPHGLGDHDVEDDWQTQHEAERWKEHDGKRYLIFAAFVFLVVPADCDIDSEFMDEDLNVLRPVEDQGWYRQWNAHGGNEDQRSFGSSEG